MDTNDGRFDWDWVIEGDLAHEGRRARRIRLRGRRHWRRVFRLTVALASACCLLGLAVFAWVAVEQSTAARAATETSRNVAMTAERRSARRAARMLKAARAYNRRLAATPQVIGERLEADGSMAGDFSFRKDKAYQKTLDFGDGIMATVEIPSIGVDLPVRHGADSGVLAEGLGHLHGTSLPVGGASTHTVITGHTGVADKSLFTRLTELREGDVFYLKSPAGRTLAYKVYDIRTVEPDDLSSLRVERGRDLATLVTCTPIFLNTHRLLVTGERVSMPGEAPYPEDAPRTSAHDMRPCLVAGVALLAGLPVAVVAARPRVLPYGRHGRTRRTM